jgi:nicotinamidase-related amidase
MLPSPHQLVNMEQSAAAQQRRTSKETTMDPLIEPHFATSALVTIDVQRDTLDGEPLEIAGTSQAVPRIAELASAFRDAGRPVVHVVRLYVADGSNAEPARRTLVSGDRPILRPGTVGRLLAPGVPPVGAPELDDDLLLSGAVQPLGPMEIALYKPRWGAFFGTTLEAHLREHHVDTLVFAGANFPNCPRTSVYQASERDFRIVVADGGLSGLTDQGRLELAGIGVILMPPAEIASLVGSENRVDHLACQPAFALAPAPPELAEHAPGVQAEQ